MGNLLCGGDRGAHTRYITSENIAAIEKNIQAGIGEWKTKYVRRLAELKGAWRNDAENQRRRLTESQEVKDRWSLQAQKDTGFEYTKSQVKEKVKRQFWALIKGKMAAESENDKLVGKAACDRIVDRAVEQVRVAA